MAFVLILDDQHLEHARQGQEGRGRQQGQPDPAPPVHLPLTDLRGVDPFHHRADPARQPPDHEDTDGDQREKLDHRLDCDGHDHAVMAFVGIQIARAEQDGEQRQPDRHPKCCIIGRDQFRPLGIADGEA